MPLVNIQDKFIVRSSGGGGVNAPSPSITNTTSTGFTVSWSAVPNAIAYRLDVATDSGFTNFVAGFNDKAVAGTSDNVTGLSPETTYYVRARSVAAGSNSGSVSQQTDVSEIPPAIGLASGLQSFYKLSDTSDSSGNGNTLTNNNGVTFSSGKIGDAAVLDGSNYLNRTSVTPFGTNDFSINAWINPNSLSNNQQMIFVGGSGGFVVSVFQNNIHLAKSGVADLYDFYNNIVTSNTWSNIVITRASNEFKAYINGSLLETWNSGSTLDFTGSEYIIGTHPGNILNFNGQIDAVGIWNRALTSGEIAELYNSGNGYEYSQTVDLTSGLQSFYKLSDTSDSSGNGNTLTNNNGVTFSSGKIGDAAVFDGSNSLDADFNFNYSDSFTASFWAKPAVNTLGTTVSILNVFNIHNDGSGTLNLNNCQSGDCTVSDAFTIGLWKHYVCVKTQGTIKVYINGQNVYDQAANVSYNGSSSSINIGRFAGTQLPFNGQIDAVGTWNRALNEAEIAELYNSGNGYEIN